MLLVVAVVLARGSSDNELLLGIYGGSDAEFAEFWNFISRLGSTATLVAMVAVFGLLLGRMGRKEQAQWLVAGFAATVLLVEMLKWTLARGRPPVEHLTAASGASFPSGHAAESLFVYFYLWMVLQDAASLRRRGAVGIAVGEVCSIALAVAAGLVGFSRVYLGVHWPSDVLGGWAVGSFVLGIAFLSGEQRR